MMAQTKTYRAPHAGGECWREWLALFGALVLGWVVLALFMPDASPEIGEVPEEIDIPHLSEWPDEPTGMEWAVGAPEEDEPVEVVQIGDKRTLNGVACTVVEVQHTTNADGGVALDTPYVGLSVFKATGVPIAFVNDEHFCAFVLKADDGVSGYAAGVYHPAIGERIGDLDAVPPVSYSAIVGWACPTITVMHNGVPVAGAYVTFQARRVSVDDGTVVSLAGADRFVDLGGGTSGEWMTDANGVVRQNLGDGSELQPIYFANGEGAPYQRVTDLRDTHAAAPTEHLAELRCYHRGIHVVVEEGQDVTINLGGGAIDVTGDAGAFAEAWLEDVQQESTLHFAYYGAVVLDGGGEGTIAGLAPGKYCVVQREDGDGAPWEKYSPRKWVTVGTSGSASVTLDALAAPPAGKSWLWVYDYGADEVAGTLYEEIGISATPAVYGSGTGKIEFNTAYVSAVLVLDGITGNFINLVTEGDCCYEATARGKVIIICADEEYAPYAASWWRDDLPHRDVPWHWPMPCRLVENTERTTGADFVEIPAGFASANPVPYRPAPTWVPPNFPSEGYWSWAADYDWRVVYLDGSPYDTVGPSENNADGLWNTGADRDTQICGGIISPKLTGGKLSGNAVDGLVPRITGATEAARMGLEWGAWEKTEVRVVTNADATGEQVGAVAVRVGEVCPYCIGPVWRWPTSTRTHGYCCQCGSDARTYARTPTVSAGSYDVRVVTYRPGRAAANVLLTKWLRPVNYLETDAYLVADWQGLGLSRWAAQHVVLASWAAGAFADGDDNADIATANGLSATVYVQPKLLPGTIASTVSYTVTCTMADTTSENFTATLPAGQSAPVMLTRQSKVAAATGAVTPTVADFIADVTGIAVASGQDGGVNSFTVVADVPAYVNAQTPFANQKQTHWACQLRVLELRHPALRRCPISGRVWLACRNQGTGEVLVYVRDSPQRPWQLRGRPFDDHQHPDILPLQTGYIIVTATSSVSGKTELMVGNNDGREWA